MEADREMVPTGRYHEYQFEKQFESDIAELDEDDELVFEEDDLM